MPGPCNMPKQLAAIRCCLLTLLVTLLPLSATRAADSKQVPCEGFAIGYDGDANSRKCTETREASGVTAVNVKQGVFSGPSFFIVVAALKGEGRTYFPMRTLEQIVADDQMIDHASDWGTQRSIRGFDAVSFKGAPSGENSVFICAVFSRYSGNPGNYEFDAGPGYPKHVEGYYCALPGYLTQAQQGDGFYALVEQVISKLRLPPED